MRKFDFSFFLAQISKVAFVPFLILSENMSDSKEIEGDPYDLPDPDLKIILLGVSSSCIRPNFAF